jgi:DNA-binding CsgD family transcriptional regulator
MTGKIISKYHRRITDEILLNIKKDYVDGMLLKDLSSKYNFSVNSIKFNLKKVIHIRKNGKVFKEEDIEKCKDLWKQGYSQTEIAKKYNITQAAVGRFLNKIGIFGRRPPYQRFLSYIDKKENGCWQWKSAKNAKGYGYLLVEGKNLFAHRYSYQHYKGAIPDSMLVCHSCDNPSCVNPEHLFLGTNINNMQDMIEKGRQCKGESKSNSKLTEEEVSEIRMLLNNGLSNKEVAIIFNVSDMTISGIKTNRTWKHVEIKE